MSDLDPNGASATICPECGHQNPGIARRCAKCGAVLPETEANQADHRSSDTEVRRREADDSPDVHPDEVPWRSSPPAGATPDHPLGEDRRFFEPARPGSLKDQGPLVDEQGEDIRQYTGEPVETEEGWVLPQQQNVGPGNEAGGGEWPDPATPSAMPEDDETEP